MSVADRHIKSLGAAAKAAVRHRQWHWCRRDNGFSDLPRWRLVAERLRMPVYQVVAFVHRLDELANAAANIGHARGHVGHFSAAEFGAALGMPAEEAARIFAALEAPDIGWVAYDHVADFYDRNPDREDDTAAERKRRQRARERGLKELARQAAAGLITADERALREAALLIDARLSTGHGGHIVTPGDIVTVTPEKRTELASPAVDNSGVSLHEDGRERPGVLHEDGRERPDVSQADRRAEDGGQGVLHHQGERPSSRAMDGRERPGGGGDPQADAQAWLESEGVRIVVERMEEAVPKAALRIARWRDQALEGDALALAEIIRGADATDYMGARFHNLVVDGVRRRQQQALGPQLKLMPPRPPRPPRRSATG
jgi:hypothetical protein